MSILWCLFIIYNAFRLKIKLLLISAGIWVGAILVLATGLPILVQQLWSNPMNWPRNLPYIAYNIDFTRRHIT
jgi:uncharacterized membrane protein (UPF0182 family)